MAPPPVSGAASVGPWVHSIPRGTSKPSLNGTPASGQQTPGRCHRPALRRPEKGEAAKQVPWSAPLGQRASRTGASPGHPRPGAGRALHQRARGLSACQPARKMVFCPWLAASRIATHQSDRALRCFLLRKLAQLRLSQSRLPAREELVAIWSQDPGERLTIPSNQESRREARCGRSVRAVLAAPPPHAPLPTSPHNHLAPSSISLLIATPGERAGFEAAQRYVVRIRLLIATPFTTPLYYVSMRDIGRILAVRYTTSACMPRPVLQRLKGGPVLFHHGLRTFGLKIQRTAE